MQGRASVLRRRTHVRPGLQQLRHGFNVSLGCREMQRRPSVPILGVYVLADDPLLHDLYDVFRSPQRTNHVPYFPYYLYYFYH